MKPSLPSLYYEAFTFAGRKLLKDWLLILVSAILIIVLQTVRSTLLRSPAGGFIAGIFEILIFSYYYYLLEISFKSRITINSLRQYEFSYFWKILSAAFIVFLMQFSFSMLDHSMGGQKIGYLLNLALILILNPLPEILYQSRSESVESLKEAASFIADHWLEWFLPLCIFLAPFVLLLSTKNVLTILAFDEVLFPVMFVTKLSAFAGLGKVSFLATWIVGLIAGNYFMFLRMELFRKLR